MATKNKKIVGLEGLYEAFLAKLSSSEREAIEKKGLAQAMPAFKKYLNSLSEVEMTALVAGESVEAPELVPGATPEKVEEVEVEDNPPKSARVEELEAMTKAELLDVALEAGIEDAKHMNKTELLDAVLAVPVRE